MSELRVLGGSEWDSTRRELVGELEQQGERSRDIFRRVVETYLESGEPVGSRTLSRSGISLSPASIRNVLSDLESLGLIFAPHTSAGRLPTELGLRFFVDGLMEFGTLDEGERQTIDKLVGDATHRNSVESLLTQAGDLLSGLSQGAGLVLVDNSDDVRIRHIEFIRLEPRKGIVVLVGEGDQVENRLIALPEGTTADSLVEAANYLNAHLRGRTLKEARDAMAAQRDAMRGELEELSQRVIDAGVASLSTMPDGAPPTFIVRGQANLLGDLTALEDLERVRSLIADLERKNDIVDLLSHSESGDGVRIFIGSDNKLFSMSGSSLIIAPYHNEEQRVVGVVGVIGPTRLNYARIVPTVDYTAQVISRLVSRR